MRTEYLQKKGDHQHLSYVEVPARRGRILDRNGEELAVSTPVDSVWADPGKLYKDDDIIQDVAQILSMKVDDLYEKISRYKNRQFVYLARWKNPEEAEEILEKLNSAGIHGVGLKREYRRFYPAGEFFSHVTGFAGRDDKGQEGVELQYDATLKASSGRKLVIRDAKRRLLEDVESIEQPREGQDIELSLDRRLQFFAYRALKRAVNKSRAKSASLVMLDVRSGEVLAMVNQPSYNPNASRSNKGGRLRNRAIVDTFEPGSTMKPITIAAAMELGYITEHTPIDTSQGFLKVGRQKITDPRKYGVLEPAGVLKKSSNVGSASIAMMMPEKDYWGILDKMGFGEPVNVDFPGEASGRLSDFHNWAAIDHANLAFGYGISASVLQLAQAYSILAADGIRRPMTILKTEHAPEGKRVFAVKTARTVRRMMESVISSEGTAPKAAINGYRVAGKTGTVKKLGKHGYEESKYRALFAGLAPVDNPRIVTVVLFDEPKGKQYQGGQVAAPVFSEVVGHALRLLNVKPDYIERPELLRLAGSTGVTQ